MWHKVISGVLALLILAAGASAARDSVDMLVDTSLYSQTSTALLQYKADVEARFNVTLNIRTGNFESQTPAQVRSYIQGEYATNGIKGVILTGQISYATWKQGYGTNTGLISEFYEDMDGSFEDRDSDGMYDYHNWGTKAGPDIWSCWMRPPTAGGQATNLNNFLAKTHAYYVGGMVVPQQALLAAHTDYHGFMEGTVGSVACSEKLFGAGNYTTIGRGSALASASAVDSALDHNAYGLFESSSHANSSLMQYDNYTNYTSSDAMNIPAGKGALLSAIYGCNSADFMRSPGLSTGNINEAVALTFGASIGQAATGTSWSYGTEYRELMYDALDQGEYLGAAWYDLISHVDTPGHIAERYGDRNPSLELAGNNLIGNPFIRVPEPATMAFLVLGGLALLRRRRAR